MLKSRRYVIIRQSTSHSTEILNGSQVRQELGMLDLRKETTQTALGSLQRASSSQRSPGQNVLFDV